MCWHCLWELLTQLVVVNFHGGVDQGAKNGDDGDFPDGHFTHRLQVLIPLLNIHTVLLTGGRNQLEEGRKVIRSETHTTAHIHAYTVRCRGGVYINLQAEDGAYFPSLPTALL